MRFLLALLSASCLVSTVAFAQTPAPAAATPTAPASAANAPVTRDQIPALVKEALINDPSILNEAVEKMRDQQEADAKKQAKEAIAKNKAGLFSDAKSPSVGDAATADITIVEFFDYHCGYCKQVLPSITELINKDKKVRVVFKEFPILSEDSVLASRAALAVNNIAKDKYFAFHTAMMAGKGKYDEKFIMDEAKKLGIDTAKLKAEIASPDISAMLDNNRKIGEAIGVRGTPAIIIGEEFFPGAMSYADLQKAVDGVRSSAAKKPAAAPAAAFAAPVAPVITSPAAPATAPMIPTPPEKK